MVIFQTRDENVVPFQKARLISEEQERMMQLMYEASQATTPEDRVVLTIAFQSRAARHFREFSDYYR